MKGLKSWRKYASTRELVPQRADRGNDEARGPQKRHASLCHGLRVEGVADDIGQLRGEVGLRQVIETILEADVAAEKIRAVATSVDHLEARVFREDALGEFQAIHVARHNDIRKEKFDLAPMLFPNLHRGARVLGLQHVVLMVHEHLLDEPAHGFIVFDDENRTLTAAVAHRWLRLFDRLDGFIGNGKINTKRRTLAGLRSRRRSTPRAAWPAHRPSPGPCRSPCALPSS